MVDLLPGVALIRAGRRWLGAFFLIAVLGACVLGMRELASGSYAAGVKELHDSQDSIAWYLGKNLAGDLMGLFRFYVFMKSAVFLILGWLLWGLSLWLDKSLKRLVLQKQPLRVCAATIAPGIVQYWLGKTNGGLLRHLFWSGLA